MERRRAVRRMKQPIRRIIGTAQIMMRFETSRLKSYLGTDGDRLAAAKEPAMSSADDFGDFIVGFTLSLRSRTDRFGLGTGVHSRVERGKNTPLICYTKYNTNQLD
jgi:hypothetical protein